MAPHKNDGRLPRKLPKAVHKVAGRRPKNVPWRRRGGSKKLTYAERKALLQRRLEKKASLLEELKKIREEIIDHAAMLAEKHPGHNVEYYKRMILQQSHLKDDPREMSLWNAFLSQELMKYNKGESWVRLSAQGSLKHQSTATRSAGPASRTSTAMCSRTDGLV